KLLQPGGGGTNIDLRYDYDEPSYERTESGDVPVKSFIGFRWATEHDVAEQRRTTTEFYHTMYADYQGGPVIGHPNDLLKGKTLWSRSGKYSGTSWHEYGATGWQEYSETDYDYQKVNYHATDTSWPVWAYFIYANQVVERTCSSGSCQGKKTVFGYDPAWGDYCTASGSRQQLGNLTHVREYDSESAATPYRTTLRGYCPNKTAWVVDKMAFDDLFAGDTTGTLKAATLYIYGTGTHNWAAIANDRGELQGVRRYAGPGQYVDTRYTYDSWGNVTQETAYNSYGSDSGWATGDPRTTDTTYDAHHTLPCLVEGQEVGTYHPETVYEYYEVNESDGSGSGLPGQLKRVRDGNNGDDTWSQYDVFGRLTRVAKPGDSLQDWTQRFDYHVGDNSIFNWGTGPRALVAVWQKTETGQPQLWTRKFYDGLGRLVQVQSMAEDWVDEGNGYYGGHEIVRYTTYDALGRVSQESLPYEVDSYDAPGSPPFSTPYRVPGSEAGTSYTYDALGRPVQTINPDGTGNEHHYGLSGTSLYDDVIDENMHLKGYLTDPFGRLVSVLEAVGTCGLWGYTCGPGETAWSVSATTEYDYDVLDNLETVTDAAENRSTMSYNLLGRKTAMTDPDMGTWNYGYDAVGNLTSQDDPRNPATTFAYDALNRLTLKNYPIGVDVYYEYDASQGGGTTLNSWGRLRSVHVGSTLGVNERLYEYDNRGRTVKEQVKIDNVTYTTLYDYDAADRVKTMTYPGSPAEPVTTVYNLQGLPETLTGSSIYADSAEYDAAGRLDLLRLGASQQWVDNVYYPWTQLNGQGRLQQIKTGPSGTPTQWQSLTYTYDAAGNVLTIADAKVLGGTQTQTFTYDHLDRLLSAVAAGGSAGQGQYGESYVYNAIGNMTNKGGVTYDYPDPGCAQPHAVTSTTAGGAFIYDAVGNMTSRTLTSAGPTYTQTWDAENRLASVTVGGKATTFTYDGNGNLVKEVGYDNLAAGIPATSGVSLNWPGVVTNEDTWADSGSGSSGEFAYTSGTGLHYV
ncbi:MAG: RHS repeat protein, partial [Chloroflexi bacterium]